MPKTLLHETPKTPLAGPASLEVQGITHEAPAESVCPHASWLRGECEEHGNIRWILRPCKRRSCPVCGPKRRARVAARIAQGIADLGGEAGAAWFVGTWPTDVDKPTAVKALARFIAWVRRNQPARPEYAVTWELTLRRRLHVNIILAPWHYVPQADLSAAWQRVGGGRVVWVQRVGAGVGVEAAKSRSQVSAYFAKWEQQVPTGRAATYSKGWPRPAEPPLQRQGKITWVPEHLTDQDSLGSSLDFQVERHLGWWYETRPGEWARANGPWCTCFQLRSPPESAPPDSPLPSP